MRRAKSRPHDKAAAKALAKAPVKNDGARAIAGRVPFSRGPKGKVGRR